MHTHNRMAGAFLLFFFAAFGLSAQSRKDKEKQLDEIKKVDTTKLSGVWEHQNTLEIDGNADLESIQFGEDGSVSYRLNGQVGLFPTLYTYTINYGQIEVKAIFDYYYIDGSLTVVFADKKVKNFARRRTGGGQPQARPAQGGQPQQTVDRPVPQQRGQQAPSNIPPGGQPGQNLNPYFR